MSITDRYFENKIMLERNDARRQQEITLLASIPKRKKRERIVSWIATTLALAFFFSVMGLFIDRLLAAWAGG